MKKIKSQLSFLEKLVDISDIYEGLGLYILKEHDYFPAQEKRPRETFKMGAIFWEEERWNKITILLRV